MGQQNIERIRRDVDKALYLTEDTLDDIRAAKSWGLWDIVGGKGVSSMMKRRKIRRINNNMRELEDQLRSLVRQLEGVENLIDFTIPNSWTDVALDIFFDNIFTDFRVQRELNSAEAGLTTLQDTLWDIKRTLNETR